MIFEIFKFLALGILIFALALGITKMVGQFAQKLEDKDKNEK